MGSLGAGIAFASLNLNLAFGKLSLYSIDYESENILETENGNYAINKELKEPSEIEKIVFEKFSKSSAKYKEPEVFELYNKKGDHVKGSRSFGNKYKTTIDGRNAIVTETRLNFISKFYMNFKRGWYALQTHPSTILPSHSYKNANNNIVGADQGVLMRYPNGKHFIYGEFHLLMRQYNL